MTDAIRKPDFFIVGAPKCGTTAMNDYLKQHPDIFIPDVKELQFFGTDLDLVRPEMSREEYLSHFCSARNEKRIGEASVLYLCSERAAQEIKEFNPLAKIIIMLRNPVDMIYALHSQLVYNGNEDITDFQAALDAEDDRRRGLRIPHSATVIKVLFYQEMAEYSRQIKRYLDVFGKDQVHIIIYDDFKQDTAKVYRQALEFLQVDPNVQINFNVINPNKTARWPSLHKFMYSRRGSWIRTAVRRLFPRSIIKYYKFLNRVYVQRQSMDPALRKRLQRGLTPEVERLSELLGRDLTYWSRS